MTDDLLHRLRRAGDVLDEVGAHGAHRPLLLSLDGPPPGHRRRAGRLVVAGLAGVLAVGGTLAVVHETGGSEVHFQSAAHDPTLGSVVPDVARVLLGEPTWPMVDVIQVTGPWGQLRFADDARSAELTWRPGEGPLLDDLVGPAPTTVAGLPASVASYADDDHVAVWGDGTTTVDLRGNGTRADFETLLATVHAVDVATWSLALPVEARTPDAGTLDQILVGVPLPPGLTPAAIAAAVPPIANRYQLTAEVTSEVVCGWVRSWLAADAAGDASAAADAVAALDSSRTWPALLAIAEEGGWSDEVWRYADAVAGRAPVPGGRDDLTIEEGIRGVGCDG